MKVEEVSAPVVFWVDSWQTLPEVAARLVVAHVGSMAVYDGDRFVGIVTERDMTRALARGLDVESATVADVMTAEPACVTPETPTMEAARMMLALDVRHLPVIEDGNVVGMVSIRDLVGDLLHREGSQV